MGSNTNLLHRSKKPTPHPDDSDVSYVYSCPFDSGLSHPPETKTTGPGTWFEGRH